MRRLLLAASMAVAATSCAYAHGDHGGGGGFVLPAGVTLVSASYDFVKYKPLGDDRLLDLAAQGQNAHSMTAIAVPSLSIAYGLTKDLTVALRAPYLINREIRETGEDPANPDVAARGGVKGFGDMSFTGTYRVLHDWKSGLDAMVTLGFKAPTGAKNVHDNYGELFETEHQPSSGSWDGLFGAGLQQTAGRWTFSANVLYGLAGHGSQDTTLGDRFSYGVAASYRIWELAHTHGGAMHLGGSFDGMMHHGGPGAHEHDHGGGHEHGDHVHGGGVALDVSLGLNGQWMGKQTIAGLADDNTGGHVLYVTPGMRLTVDKWAGFVNVGVPVMRELNGIQSEPAWTVSTGVAVQF